MLKESACNAGDPGSIPGLGRSPAEGIGYLLQYSWASLVAQLVRNPPATQETWVWSLGWEDPLEKRMATHFSILAWRIPWTVLSMGLLRVRHDWMTFTFTFSYVAYCAFLRAHMTKNLPAMQETWVWFLGQEDPLGREWLSTPVFLPGELHGQGNPGGYSPWGRKELDMSKQLILYDLLLFSSYLAIIIVVIIFIIIFTIIFNYWYFSVCSFSDREVWLVRIWWLRWWGRWSIRDDISLHLISLKRLAHIVTFSCPVLPWFRNHWYHFFFPVRTKYIIINIRSNNDSSLSFNVANISHACINVFDLRNNLAK